MPIVPIIKAIYPKVPAVAGVPQLLRSGAQIFDTLTLGLLGAGDFVNSILGAEPVRWGVFEASGKAISQYDSVTETEFHDSGSISNYQIEQGSFAAYNKVDNPFTKLIVLTCGGDINRRNAFQNDLRDARRSLKLYTVITEDATYKNCNLVGLSWMRTATNGAHQIVATCEFQEVRQTAGIEFSAAIPSGAVLREQGQLQPIPDVTIDTSGVA